MEIGKYEPGNLIAGGFPLVTGFAPASKKPLKRGTVVTKDGEAMAPGGEPYGVLAEDSKAQAEKAVVYLTGEFAGECLVLEGGAALGEGDAAKLRLLSIFAKASFPGV